MKELQNIENNYNIYKCQTIIGKKYYKYDKDDKNKMKS
jgi:hypothetical protein